MHYKKLQLSLLLIVLGLTGLNAQEVIPASGGNATGAGGSVSYTVGQIMNNTNQGTNGSVAEGVQQPFEISVVTGIEDITGIVLSTSIYPNPTSDYLTLRVEDYDGMNLSYQLFDVNGRLLENIKVTGSETTISMVQFSPGAYFLKILDSNKDIKTFKIIKN